VSSRALADRGVHVELGRLPAGDYDLGGGRLVERKTVPDLHLSLQRGRLWRQIGELREQAVRPYLLIEGTRLDDRTSHPDAIRGACLAVIGLGIPLLRTADAADSARWLHLLARRAAGVRLARDRPTYAQRLKPPDRLVKEAMLAAIPGISVARARSLLDSFGSVAAVATAGPTEWRKTPGIGPAAAKALERAFS
jgi:ERCC4-type nuclease